MKNQIILFMLTVIPTIMWGQPTINIAENYTIGTVLKFQSCDSSGVYAGSSGANQTWDFSSLSALPDTITERMVLPSSTPFGNSFPSSNLAKKLPDNKYAYYDNNTNNSFLVGFVDTTSSFIINYPNSLLFAQRPITYETMVIDTFTDNYSVAGGDFSGGGTVTINGDGYGTLILPNGTHNNVLRIKTTQIQSDTLIQHPYISTSTTITYAWYDGTNPSPLLKIDSIYTSNFVSKTVTYFLSKTTGITEISEQEELQFYPNPATEHITLMTKEKGILTITNKIGQVVFITQINESGTIISTNNLQPGIYQLIFQTSKQKPISKPLLIQR